MPADVLSRTWDTRKRVCSILGVSSSTRWIARHISADIFFRQRKEISDDLAEAHPPLRSTAASATPCPIPFPLPCRILFPFFNFLRRERMACRSRLSIQMGLAYRDRADHPLFPRRTTPFPMNNTSSRGNRYADCRSVPTHTLSRLFLRRSHAAAIQDIRIWVSGNPISLFFFFPFPLFLSPRLFPRRANSSFKRLPLDSRG